MTWQNYLNDAERAELGRAQEKRDLVKSAFNEVRLRLKNRAEARKRRQEKRDA